MLLVFVSLRFPHHFTPLRTPTARRIGASWRSVCSGVPLVVADSTNWICTPPLRFGWIFRRSLSRTHRIATPIPYATTTATASTPHAPTPCLTNPHALPMLIGTPISSPLLGTFEKKSEILSEIFASLPNCLIFDKTKCHYYERIILQSSLQNRFRDFNRFTRWRKN